MKYEKLTESNISILVKMYKDYYNNSEECCWTYDKAFKRIHQVMTMEDSMCLIQKDDNDKITGFEIGYFKEYDDLSSFFLEEIVIFAEYQDRGYGSLFLKEIESKILSNNCKHLELLSINDEKHIHFYTKAGLYSAKNLVIMGKHYS